MTENTKHINNNPIIIPSPILIKLIFEKSKISVLELVNTNIKINVTATPAKPIIIIVINSQKTDLFFIHIFLQPHLMYKLYSILNILSTLIAKYLAISIFILRFIDYIISIQILTLI